MSRTAVILNRAENLFGGLNAGIRRRIIHFLQNPTADNWDDISGIIICNSFDTIWQVMVAYAPDFPRRGRAEDFEGNIVRDWEQIPTPDELLHAMESVLCQR